MCDIMGEAPTPFQCTPIAVRMPTERGMSPTNHIDSLQSPGSDGAKSARNISTPFCGLEDLSPNLQNKDNVSRRPGFHSGCVQRSARIAFSAVGAIHGAMPTEGQSWCPWHFPLKVCRSKVTGIIFHLSGRGTPTLQPTHSEYNTLKS